MQDQKADQSKILELQILSQNLQNIQAQMQKLDSNLDEFQVLRKSLDELKKINRDTEIIIPLGQGVFTRGRITEKNNLLNLVGAEIAVEKSIDETKESVSGQINSLMKVRVELESEMAKGVEKIQKIQSQIKE
ncbi:prefoldin subunit alpha [Candidatus Woesearchaeota archaeon]|nr:prefoldin subunit alpha [Candidatus Woesearchaeota archaeon]